MTATQQRLIVDVPTQAEHLDDMRERHDDPTPPGAVDEVLEAALPHLLPAGWIAMSQARNPRLSAEPPLRVLDVGAGCAVWSQRLRRLAHARGFPVHITGVELDGRKAEHGRKWCDEYVVMDWRKFCRGYDGPRFDLAMGNPPFKQLLVEGEEPMVAELLKIATAVLLLHRLSAWLRKDTSRAAWRDHPAERQWQLPPVGFRGKGTDISSYAVSLFRRGHDGPTTSTMLGDPIGGASWQWTGAGPGTESPEDADALGLPLAPGYESKGTMTK